MKPTQFLKSTAMALATFHVALPTQLLNAQAPNNSLSSPVPIAAPKACDVVLGPGGRLSGQVVDANGAAKGDLLVAIEQAGQKVAEAKTDKQGRFTFDNIRGGACQIQVAGNVSSCRCWTASVAPPSAKPGVLVISDPQLERGQRPINEILTNPILIGLVIAAAIAIPITVANSQNSPSGS